MVRLLSRFYRVMLMVPPIPLFRSVVLEVCSPGGNRVTPAEKLTVPPSPGPKVVSGGSRTSEGTVNGPRLLWHGGATAAVEVQNIRSS
jgi:hypothetical protein